MNPYIFKRKDEPIAIINLTEDGSIVNYKLNSKNEELAPLHTEGSTNWLKEWWKRRAVPIEQGHIKTMLKVLMRFLQQRCMNCSSLIIILHIN